VSLSDRYDERLLGELAALADGSLDGPRRAELESRVAEDPELAAALAEQQRAVTLIRGAAAEVELPPALRARLAEFAPAHPAVRAERSEPRFRRLGWQPGVTLAAAAAVLVALVIALTGGPTVEDAAAFAALPPTAAAPSTDGTRLMAVQDGVAFPRWDSEKLGWQATGMHTGDVDGRPATTVYYEKDGRTLAYTIVAGDALDGPEGSRSLTVGGTTVKLFDSGAGRAATWQRDGHTCVLAGRDVPDAKLAELAGWKAPAA
jgi:anti-sigma factor RsiW